MAEIPSPFSVAVREAQLPVGYRNTTSDLRFHESSDPLEFLGRFNIEMDVENESLTSYFKRFNAESTSVRGASDEALKIFLIARLRVGLDFWKYLQGKDPTTIVVVFALAESFKSIEQSLAEVQPTSQTSQGGRARKRDRYPSPRYRRSIRILNRVNAITVRREWSPPSSYDSRTSGYTPLATSIEHIFEVNKNRGLFRKPEALSYWKSKDKKKYCEYHELSGHNTHECRQLKDEIEALIKEGYLGEWVVKEVRRHKSGTNKAKEEGGRSPRGSNNETLEENKFVRDSSIRSIYGGDPGMEYSNRALERYAREARFRPLTDIHRVETRPPKVFKGEYMDINFREADVGWVHHPHNDALVISLQIGTKNVSTDFVDNGSSAITLTTTPLRRWDCLIEICQGRILGSTVFLVKGLESWDQFDCHAPWGRVRCP
ncbi:uncharacterized protein LOC141719065 [Apium graveolens]|uniref:uncharacterized protein LOC141719065 n=1 Tax=Apium graveolens TaxID=4045 RepID=UPI003D7AFDC9